MNSLQHQRHKQSAPAAVRDWSANLSFAKNIQTTCPYCGVGCGVLVNVDEQGEVAVKGDPDHPANLGRLCSKGSALAETVYHEGRLLYPTIKGKEVNWELALSAIADQFQDIIQTHGADAIAFYVSGQLMTEDYYVANKLMKGFIGSANIDTNSRLCMSSAVAAYKRAFGEDVVPCQYEDLEKASLIVITGSNLAWCHPVIYQRIGAAKKHNPEMKIVLIDPRQTQTSSIADLHLSVQPGTDGLLFNGLLHYLIRQQHLDQDFIDQHTQNFQQLQQTADISMETIAEQCGLKLSELELFYQWFARTEQTVSLYSQGINQSSSGTDKANSIINCHLLTGRIGKPGMGPFSITGQPNAMGGREVGGLANQLAAHMDISNSEHRQLVQEFWNSPVIASSEGYKAVDLFDAMLDGKIKAVWIMATNPVVSLPDSDKVKKALAHCELVIVSDCMADTDTGKLADIQLPAITWGEREGTVTNSERCISRQRAFLSAPGVARPDWWIISQLATYMGYGPDFNYAHAADIFREHCRLSAYKNSGERLFNLAHLSDIDFTQYQQLKPTYWPDSNTVQNQHILSDEQFSHADHKARLVPIEPRLPSRQPDNDFPFRLNSGRVRDHWHSMTRTGMSPKLSAHTIEPYVEIHPIDAKKYTIQDGALVKVSSPLNSYIIVRAVLSEKQQRGSLFVPIHWNQQFSARAGVGSLFEAFVDPLSGQPETKHGIAAIEPYLAKWYGFMISRESPDFSYASYWTKSRGQGLWRYEFAGTDAPENWSDYIKQNFTGVHTDSEWVELYDKSLQHYRGIHLQDNKLQTCIFIYSEITLPPRDWLISLFHKNSLSKDEHNHLLKAMPPSEQQTQGKIICSCFNVGEKTIREAINTHSLKTVEEIGEKCQAGSNCGSCRPELAEFL